MAEKRKIVNRWEIFFLIVISLIFLTTILGKFNIHVVEQTEDTQLIEHPHRDF